jgi:hypothetical protein
LPGVRVRELIEPLGYEGGKSIVDDYLREVRPLFMRARTHQRTVYRPGEICRWDLWEPSVPVPVGYGQARRAWVVVACMGYSRAGAGALVFSKEAPDVLWGMGRCLWSLGALPALMVWDREGCLHAGGGRPTDVYAGFCGRLPVDWYFCEPGDAPAKGCVERLQGYLETNFEPGRRFANQLDFQLQLDAWFEKANARTHKTLRARPIDRLAEERALMRALPATEPDETTTSAPARPPRASKRPDRSPSAHSPRASERPKTRRPRAPKRENRPNGPSRAADRAGGSSLRSTLRAFAPRAAAAQQGGSILNRR